MQPPSPNSISSVEATEANGYQQELESAVQSILLWTQATLVTDNSGGNLHSIIYIGTLSLLYMKTIIVFSCKHEAGEENDFVLAASAYCIQTKKLLALVWFERTASAYCIQTKKLLALIWFEKTDAL